MCLLEVYTIFEEMLTLGCKNVDSLHLISVGFESKPTPTTLAKVDKRVKKSSVFVVMFATATCLCLHNTSQYSLSCLSKSVTFYTEKNSPNKWVKRL